MSIFKAVTKCAQQECKFYNATKKLKSANSYAALWVKSTFFNAFSSLKFTTVSLYLVNIFSTPIPNSYFPILKDEV
ncbi:hypothetical protein [Nitratiruptor sp. SB155-2]|uniref:hypothetical protein n=1 Tax=Nitratiruptor sp. (strain SB155-2) TaxID=387092 RepID=UPI00059BDC7D|nr:hypothetical protein [Nitratiruptor sp. SB155-2]